MSHPLSRFKITRRDGVAEAFDFYDTFNPRYNRIDKLPHLDWPIIRFHAKHNVSSRAVFKEYQVKHSQMETRSPFLTELSPPT